MGLNSRDDVRLILQIHDELVFEVKKDVIEQESKKIKDIMENVLKLEIPLLVGVEYGDSLGEMEDLVI